MSVGGANPRSDRALEECLSSRRLESALKETASEGREYEKRNIYDLNSAGIYTHEVVVYFGRYFMMT